ERRERSRMHLEVKTRLVVPEIHIDADDASEQLAQALAQLGDYRNDPINTVGKGELTKALQVVGDGSKASVIVRETPHSNRVMARWLVRRSLQALYPEVVQTIDWSDDRF